MCQRWLLANRHQLCGTFRPGRGRRGHLGQSLHSAHRKVRNTSSPAGRKVTPGKSGCCSAAGPSGPLAPRSSAEWQSACRTSHASGMSHRPAEQARGPSQPPLSPQTSSHLLVESRCPAVPPPATTPGPALEGAGRRVAFQGQRTLPADTPTGGIWENRPSQDEPAAPGALVTAVNMLCSLWSVQKKAPVNLRCICKLMEGGFTT